MALADNLLPEHCKTFYDNSFVKISNLHTIMSERLFIYNKWVITKTNCTKHSLKIKSYFAKIALVGEIIVYSFVNHVPNTRFKINIEYGMGKKYWK